MSTYFQYLAAGTTTIITLVLLAVAAWLGYRALPLLRARHAINSAPLVQVASGEEGLVKVVGTAIPGQDPPAGYSFPDKVWSRRFRMSSTSINTGTTTYSVGLMMLRDETGECLVDPEKARVFHSMIESKSSHFLDTFRIDSEYRINTGDTVFAIGVLGKAKTRPGRDGLPRCTLRPSSKGVLIYSGQSEGRTMLRLQARYWPLVGCAVVLALVAVWGLRAHMQTYSTDGEFLQTLVSTPWAPLWERHPELFQEAPADAPANNAQ